MDEPRDYQLVSADQTSLKKELAKPDPGATPFKVVVDPEMRLKLRRSLIELIDYHDEALAEHFAEGKLALESYKEYIELFARSLKETMEAAKAFRTCCARSGSMFRRRKSTFILICVGRRASPADSVRACSKSLEQKRLFPHSALPRIRRIRPCRQCFSSRTTWKAA